MAYVVHSIDSQPFSPPKAKGNNLSNELLINFTTSSNLDSLEQAASEATRHPVGVSNEAAEEAEADSGVGNSALRSIGPSTPPPPPPQPDAPGEPGELRCVVAPGEDELPGLCDGCC